MKYFFASPYTFLSILLLLPAISFGQTGKGSASGIVQDSTGPIPYVSIYLENTKLGTITDASGKFQIKDIPSGEHTLIISLIGFHTVRKKISIKDGQITSADITLKKNVLELEEVILKMKSKKEEIMEQGFSVEVIDAAPLQNRNMDVSKALNQALGIRVRQDAGLGSSFNLTMNGLNARQFINGIPIEVYGNAYKINNIPINLVQRVEIYKGVVPVHLGGDALGGAINIITKNKMYNNLNATYSYGSFNTHKASLYGTYIDTATGFTTIASGFINYSDNNYTMRNMEIIDNSFYVKKNVKRFNDRYFSYSGRIETGLTGKKYADALLIGFGYNGVKKDIQTGPLQYPAAGDVTGKETGYQGNLHYYKTGLWNNKIDLNLFLLYGNNHTNFTDTSSISYQWDGSILSTRPWNSDDGELGDKQIFINKESNFIQRYTINYHLHPLHTIGLNFISTNARRKTRDEWVSRQTSSTSPMVQPSDYSKSVIGLSYDSKLIEKRLQTSLFVKRYTFNAKIENALSWEGGWFGSHGLSIHKTYYGGGLASSLMIANRILVKGSVEYAYRIPSIYEILGDGINTVANTNLLPESSMNYNAGVIIKCIDRNNLNITWSNYGFLRYSDNFIRAIPGSRRVVYSNFSEVLVRGVESEVATRIYQKLVARFNLSYQQVLDNSKFVGSTQIENYTYRQQLPNTPHLFGYIDISYNLLKLINNIYVSPYYTLNYLNQFYLGFANVAKGGDKYIIPTQFIHDMGITFSNPEYPVSISFECANMTDAFAYDNFRLQKPGRAFSIKLNYTL